MPFVVEAWAHADSTMGDSASLRVHVNRTPITGELRASKDKRELTLWGCGLYRELKVPKGAFDIVANITTPYCPITTDGKEPDLRLFADAIESAIKRAVQRAAKTLPKEPVNPNAVHIGVQVGDAGAPLWTSSSHGPCTGEPSRRHPPH